MPAVIFDTLKLAQRLEAAGLAPQQAEGVAAALAETIGENVVTRDYLDLRLSETKTDILKWTVGTIGFQTVIVIGAVAGLFRLLH